MKRLPWQVGSVTIPLAQVAIPSVGMMVPEAHVNMHTVPSFTEASDAQLPDISGVEYVGTIQSAPTFNISQRKCLTSFSKLGAMPFQSTEIDL